MADVDDTIEAEGGLHTPSDGAIPVLDPRTSLSSLKIGPVIGEGGMGVVRAAVQRSLARPVAIKTPHPGATEKMARRMLREAWVTGFLEHPGVVPVYDIVKGDGGAPVVVMRRIQGATWEERLPDAAWAAAEGARDLLEQNLRVFVRVCEVVEFAHAKGVLHRDIKPANVMVGAFGEIYLLDWGLALALSDEAAKHLPPAGAEQELTGTLSYAAPEMVGFTDSPLERRTDVYLLGAVLFEIAVGRAPHDRPTVSQTFESIGASPPVLDASVSPRLAAIVRRAMAREPMDRHPSVSDLRRDVLDFLRSRDSEHLVAAAEALLARLGEECSTGGSRRRIYDLYGECRFAFREALRTWPQNEAASRGLARAAELVIEHELTRDPRVASALLEEARGVSPELASRVRAAAASDDREREGLTRLARDHDPDIGGRSRIAFFMLLGLAWSVSQIVAARVGTVSHAHLAVLSLVQLPLLLVAWHVAREASRTLFNRRLLAIVAITLCGQAMLFLVGGMLRIELSAVRTLQVGLWVVLAACLTVLLERRFWPMTVGLTAALGVALAWPSARPYASALATLGVVANIGAVWTFSASSARRGTSRSRR